MTEFWESSFRDKQEMWGFEPADCALTTLELFKEQGFTKILIPGFGYGRNASVFTENGFNVTGIEISETAIELRWNFLLRVDSFTTCQGTNKTDPGLLSST